MQFHSLQVAIPTFRAASLTIALLAVSLLQACGGSSEAKTTPSISNGWETPGSSATANRGYITFQIDGQEWKCEGNIRDRSMTLNRTDLNLTLLANLPGHDGPLAPELSLVIEKKNLKPGTSTFDYSFYDSSKRDAEVAQMKLLTEGVLPNLSSREGSITFDTLRTTTEGVRNYQVLEATGSFEGTFQGSDGEAYNVSGTFGFTR